MKGKGKEGRTLVIDLYGSYENSLLGTTEPVRYRVDVFTGPRSLDFDRKVALLLGIRGVRGRRGIKSRTIEVLALGKFQKKNRKKRVSNVTVPGPSVPLL